MSGDLTLPALVGNGTMSEEVAALLWAAVDEQVSFLVVAVPRFAGKSTTSNAILEMRAPDVPLHYVAGEPALMDRLVEQRLGGYLVVAEFSDAPVPGYIWGKPVRHVFDALDAGYSLQASLHAPSPEDAVLEITRGNGISDEKASAIGLVIYIERFGTDLSNFWRRVANVYEVDRVENGRAVGRTLFRWTPETDRFDAVESPRGFAQDESDLISRGELIGDLARSGRTSSAEVQNALARFRESRRD
ncbi:MAG TPA: hypothetical protein VH951_02080 [Dehalococcoidia bacterium]|jgi:hypothetical protein